MRPHKHRRQIGLGPFVGEKEIGNRVRGCFEADLSAPAHNAPAGGDLRVGKSLAIDPAAA